MTKYDVNSISNSAEPIERIVKHIKETKSPHLEPLISQSTHDDIVGASEWPLPPLQKQSNPSMTEASLANEWPHLYLERTIVDGPLIYSNTHYTVGYGNALAANEWPPLPIQQQAYPSLMAAENEWTLPSVATTYHSHPSMLPNSDTVLHNLVGLVSPEANSSTIGIYNDISNTSAANEWPLLPFKQQENPLMAAAYHPHPSMLPTTDTVLHNISEYNSSTAVIYNQISNTSVENGFMMQNYYEVENEFIMQNSYEVANEFIMQNSSATQFANNSGGPVSSKAPSAYQTMIFADPSGTDLCCLTQQQVGTLGNETVTCNNNWMIPSLQNSVSAHNQAPLSTVLE